MVKWLQEVAYQLSNNKNDYSPCTLYELILDHDDKKIPDVTINGRSFDLPIKDLHEALRKGKQTRRLGAFIVDLVCSCTLLIGSLYQCLNIFI